MGRIVRLEGVTNDKLETGGLEASGLCSQCAEDGRVKGGRGGVGEGEETRVVVRWGLIVPFFEHSLL